jgi:hypothetical protein
MHDSMPGSMHDPVHELPNSLTDRIFMALVYSVITVIMFSFFCAVADRLSQTNPKFHT